MDLDDYDQRAAEASLDPGTWLEMARLALSDGDTEDAIRSLIRAVSLLADYDAGVYRAQRHA